MSKTLCLAYAFVQYQLYLHNFFGFLGVTDFSSRAIQASHLLQSSLVEHQGQGPQILAYFSTLEPTKWSTPSSKRVG